MNLQAGCRYGRAFCTLVAVEGSIVERRAYRARSASPHPPPATSSPEPRHMKAIPSIQVDDQRVLVTEWRFAPGAETGHHVHAHDYVVVPLLAGTLRLEESGGVRDVHLQAGASYARKAGVAHNVINVNAYEFRFVEIELK
jgi:beta-alanine degradation protein BauB